MTDIEITLQVLVLIILGLGIYGMVLFYERRNRE